MAESRPDKEKTSIQEWFDKILQYLPYIAPLLSLLGSAKVLFSDLPLFWKLSIVTSLLALAGWMVYRTRRRKLRNLTPKEPGKLRLTEEDFSGREEDVRRLIKRIQENRIVYLVGESGSGKTTLIDLKIIAAAELTSRYEVIKVSSYGPDWVRGPLLALLESKFGGKADLWVRKASKSTDEQLVSEARQRITSFKKQTLIIFDQFDYYLANCSKELLEDGAVLDHRSLRSANMFWDMIFDLVDNDRIKCIFVLEDKLLRFAQPFISGGRIYPLNRLEHVYARLLLEKVVGRAGYDMESTVVQDLLRRIARDLDNELLPVKLEFTLRSLQYLDPFAPATYSRLGGIHGLIAHGMRKDITTSVSSWGLTYKEALSMLQNLVDDEDKPCSKTIEDVMPHRSGPTAAAVKSAFEEMEERRIVKRQPDQEGTETWTLYHEFLVHVLLELYRQEREYEITLRESHQKYLQSSWRQKNQALLPFRVSWSLLAARMRGRLNLGGAWFYLLLSALRVPLLFLGALAVLAAVLYYQRAGELGSRVVARFDSSSGLRDEEVRAIWLLYGASDLLKKRTLEAFLESEESAGRFWENRETILQALSNLSSKSFEDDMEAVWRSRCRYQLQNLGPNRLRICALLESELHEASLESWAEYSGSVPHSYTVRLFEDLEQAEQVKGLDLVLETARSNDSYRYGIGMMFADILAHGYFEADPKHAHEVLDRLVSLGDTAVLASFYESLPDSISPLVAPRVSAMIRQVVAGQRTGRGELGWSRTVADLKRRGWSFGEELEGIARNTVTKSISSEDLPMQERLELLSLLGAFREDLAEAEISLARQTFFSAVKDCSVMNSWSLEALSTFVHVLSSEDAAMTIELLSRRDHKVLSDGAGDGRKYLQALFQRVDEGERPGLLKRYWERLREARSLEQGAVYLLILGHLGTDSDKSALAEEIIELAETTEPGDRWNRARIVANVARSLWGGSGAQGQPSRRLAMLVRSLFVASLVEKDAEDAEALADLMEGLGITLAAESSARYLEKILSQGALPCRGLAPLVQKETVRLLVEQGFRYPVCPRGISMPVLKKLDKLHVLRIEDVGWADEYDGVIDKGKLMDWIERNNYDLAGPLRFRGAL